MNYQLEALNPESALNSMAQFLFTLLLDIGRMEQMTFFDCLSKKWHQARSYQTYSL
jgi:hypothetical protein